MLDLYPAPRRPLLRLALFSLAAGTLTACNSGPQPATQPPTGIASRSAAPSAAAANDTYAPRSRHHSNHASANSTPGQFDYYLLTLSWSPEYCHSHSSAPECAAHSTFVLHGLWPQNADGTYPENCSDAPGPANPSQYSDIYPDPGLLEHEWTEHGTCSGLPADQFFTDARTAFHSVAIPPTFQSLSQSISLAPNAILTQFTAANPGLSTADLALSCGNNYLTAVEVCLDKNLHPTACGQVRSCGATAVRIPPPQS